MAKQLRYGAVAIAIVMVAMLGSGAALAYDDGRDAPFAVGTELSNTLGKGGVVVANMHGKSYVWDEATNRCWAYQRQSVNDAGYTTSAIVPLENLTGTCDRYKPEMPAPPPPPRQVCEWVQVSKGYTYLMPVIESGGFANGAVPATNQAICATVPTPSSP